MESGGYCIPHLAAVMESIYFFFFSHKLSDGYDVFKDVISVWIKWKQQAHPPASSAVSSVLSKYMQEKDHLFGIKNYQHSNFERKRDWSTQERHEKEPLAAKLIN